MSLLTKLLNTIQDAVEVIEDQYYGYLRCRSNWHKHPVISRLCCAIGRHDYEFAGLHIGDDSSIAGDLYCFYCENKRRSGWCTGTPMLINGKPVVEPLAYLNAIARLQEEGNALLARMQTPQSKQAMESLFEKESSK